jgi:hypothetical protein
VQQDISEIGPILDNPMIEDVLRKRRNPKKKESEAGREERRKKRQKDEVIVTRLPEESPDGEGRTGGNGEQRRDEDGEKKPARPGRIDIRA